MIKYELTCWCAGVLTLAMYVLTYDKKWDFVSLFGALHLNS